MKIIITMAGLGNRFKTKGFDIPKYKIVVKNKTLFEWALISLTDFFNQEFIFITRAEIFDEEFLTKTCKSIGILKFNFVVLKEQTDGQATTALLAGEYISDNDAIAIYNIDTYVKPGEIRKKQIKDSYSGFIPVIRANSEKWSFVKVNVNYFATEVAEKKQISDLATIGFYYFDNWKTYKDTYKIMLEKIKRENREVYIAPMYQYLIDNGKKVYIHVLRNEIVEIMGTPEELEAFRKKSDSELL